MTLGDLEWPFHASRAISAVAKLRVIYCILLIFIDNRRAACPYYIRPINSVCNTETPLG